MTHPAAALASTLAIQTLASLVATAPSGTGMPWRAKSCLP